MQPDAAPVIEARNVAFAYGERRALDGLTLSVPGGSIFGLLGPNGSGKSTFTSLLAAQEVPPEGTLRVFGKAPSAALRRRIGTVFQENTADPLMTAGANLRLAGKLFGLGGAVVNERTEKLLKLFGLGDRIDDDTVRLSGGMRRRLELARALLHDPELLLLDEPTTGVDPGERRALWDALAAARGARTVLLATNDLAEADAICDAVAFLQDGRVVATGTPAELKRGLRRESVRITWPGAASHLLAELESWPDAGTVTRDGDTLHLTTNSASDFVPRLFALANGGIRGISINASTLEDAYFQHVRTAASPDRVVVA